jgi:hypothetical protein
MVKGNKLSKENKVNGKINLQRRVKETHYHCMNASDAGVLQSILIFLDTINGLVFLYETRPFGNWMCFCRRVNGESNQRGPLEGTSLCHWTQIFSLNN